MPTTKKTVKNTVLIYTPIKHDVIKFRLFFFSFCYISYYLGYLFVLIYLKAYLLKDQGYRNAFKTFHWYGQIISKYLNLT